MSWLGIPAPDPPGIDPTLTIHRGFAEMSGMRIGILLALLSAILFGASTPLAKTMLVGVDPWMMAGLLYLGAGIGLAGIHLARNALRLPDGEAPLRRVDLPWLAGVIAAGGILGPLFLIVGLPAAQC